jgi:hypothetical protein
MLLLGSLALATAEGGIPSPTSSSDDKPASSKRRLLDFSKPVLTPKVETDYVPVSGGMVGRAKRQSAPEHAGARATALQRWRRERPQNSLFAIGCACTLS